MKMLSVASILYLCEAELLMVNVVNKVWEQVAHLSTTWCYIIRYWATNWQMYQAYNYKQYYILK